jgi:hypothetical protein
MWSPALRAFSMMGEMTLLGPDKSEQYIVNIAWMWIQ